MGNTDVLNIVPTDARYIFDIGCGDGSNARLLVQKSSIVDGVTLSEDEKEEAKKSTRQI